AASSARYTLSLHDALPISGRRGCPVMTPTDPLCSADTSHHRPRSIHRTQRRPSPHGWVLSPAEGPQNLSPIRTWRGRRTELLSRSEEHTSELQSRENLVCR